MTAVRWILFSLLAFGLGTGAAFAVHPPTTGIPNATARGLAGNLDKIQDYATAGRCYAVRGQLSSAQAKIRDLPVSTPSSTAAELQAALEKIRTEALATCSRATAEAAPTATPEAETTPETTPEPSTPSETPPPDTTPDLGDAPETETTPVDPGDDGQGDEGDGDGEESNGGVTIPNGSAIRKRIDEERKRREKQLKDIEKALKQP